MQRAFRKLLKEWDVRWEDNAKKGGRSSCISYYYDLLTILKLENKSLRFKTDIDIIRERNDAIEKEMISAKRKASISA